MRKPYANPMHLPLAPEHGKYAGSYIAGMRRSYGQTREKRTALHTPNIAMTCATGTSVASANVPTSAEPKLPVRY